MRRRGSEVHIEKQIPCSNDVEQLSQICQKQSPWGPETGGCIRQMAVVLTCNVRQRARNKTGCMKKLAVRTDLTVFSVLKKQSVWI
jgi:hypothetical protein